MAAGVLQLRDAKSKSELRRVRDALRESYGPFGRLSLLHPFPGAALTSTNRAGKIVQLLKTGNPIIKLLLTSLQMHCQHFKEAGLYAALLSTNLIMKGLELPYSQYKVAMVTGYVMSVVCDWLESAACTAKRRLSLTSTEELMALVKTFLGSKLTVYGVSSAQLDHISSLLLQGFLRVSPSSEETSFSFGQRLHLLPHPGHPVHQSLLLGGVVIPVSKEDSGLRTVKRTSDGEIVVALFDTSLSGDFEDFPEGVSLEAEPDSGLADTAFDDVVVERLMGVASHLVELGVGFVGCQKCIHPQVKDYLREKGVYVVERLSSLHFEPVRSVSGAELITSRSNEAILSDCQLGRLREVKSHSLLGETFLQLEGVSETHCSVILTSRLKMMVEEMTDLCNDAVSILEQTLRSPYVLSGGGCMETLTAHYLSQKSREDATEELLSELQCDQHTLSAVTASVAKSFVSMATWVEHDRGTVAVDSTFHHCWSLPPLSEATPTLREAWSCRCGSVTSSMLPNGSGLTLVGGAGESMALVKENVTKIKESCSLNFPRVCDCFLARLRATEMSGDVAATVLRTAWVAVATATH